MAEHARVRAQPRAGGGRGRSQPGVDPRVDAMLALQHVAGNAAVGQQLARHEGHGEHSGETNYKNLSVGDRLPDIVRTREARAVSWAMKSDKASDAELLAEAKRAIVTPCSSRACAGPAATRSGSTRTSTTR